jgi:hypothetical protein
MPLVIDKVTVVYHYHRRDNIKLQLLLTVNSGFQMIMAKHGRQSNLVDYGMLYLYHQVDNTKVRL